MRRTTILTLALAFATLTCACGTNREVHVDTRTYDEPIEAIVITGDAISVDLVGEDVGSVVVEEYRNRHGEQPDVKISLRGGVLRIDSSCPMLAVRCASTFSISAPADVEVDIDGGAGSVYLDGLAGDLFVETGAGSIEMRDISGSAQLITGAGSIEGRSMQSATLRAEAGSGSVELQYVVLPELLEVSTGAGSVDLLVPAGSYDLHVKTGLGSQDVFGIVDDPSAAGRIAVDTGAGSVTIFGRD